MLEGWAYALVIVFSAVAWIHIFLDYRKKLMRVMPSVEEVSTRKKEFSSRISEAESNSENIVHSMSDLKGEIEKLDEQRRELQEKVNRREMVLIPAGRFDMGSNLPARDEENPEHRVRMKAYYIDRYEVTNLQYKDFVHAAGYRSPVHWRNRNFTQASQANHPVVNVSWEDARAYAEWMGKRLPTEAEWERAARGDYGNEYPWGKTASQDHANFANPDSKTTPVEKYPSGKSDHDVYDMCGNVGEWVNDWYDPKYYTRTAEADPQGPEDGSQKVYRGGGYHCNRMDIRAAGRHYATPKSYQEYIGFRCAMDAEE